MEALAQICLEVWLSAVLMGRAFMWRNVPLLNCVLLYTYDKDQRRKYILPIIFELSENNQYFFFPEPVRMSCGIDGFPNRFISILYFHWFQGIYSFFMLTTKLCWYWPIISLNRNTKVFLSQHNNLACFISLCQGTATSGSINHMYERLYVTESKLRVHLDSPLLKERRVFLEENANMGKSKDRLRILASYIFTLRMLCIYTTGKMI